MAWRSPNITDLIAVLNTREVEVYQRANQLGEPDPAQTLITQAVGVLRGYLRRGGVPMSPIASEIPAEVMGPCMEYAAYTLCKRFAVSVTKERTDAWNAALDMFRAIGERKLSPEPYQDPDTAATGGRVLPMVSNPTEGAILG